MFVLLAFRSCDRRPLAMKDKRTIPKFPVTILCPRLCPRQGDAGCAGVPVRTRGSFEAEMVH